MTANGVVIRDLEKAQKQTEAEKSELRTALEEAEVSSLNTSGRSRERSEQRLCARLMATNFRSLCELTG